MSIHPHTPIVQFGTSRFLQAHADLFISEAMARGEALGPITVVQSSGNPERRHRLAALSAAGGFTVRIEGVEGGRPVRREARVTSIQRGLTTEADWEELCRIVATEARVILSNTGDAGWQAQAQDVAQGFTAAMSYPAKLTHLLQARFRAGGGAIQVMPTELVARNGDRLAERVAELAPRLGADFADWVTHEVTFVNSLVDRIVSAPLEPAGAVAEPYALWAIEDRPGLVLPCRHPAVQVVTSLERIERLKLHILNLSHTVLVQGWQDSGRRGATLVRELLADQRLRAGLEDLLAAEVVPTFARVGHGADAVAYVTTTLDRLANPCLDHHLADIAQNHAEKIRHRIGAFLDWSDSLGLPATQIRLRRICSPDAQT